MDREYVELLELSVDQRDDEILELKRKIYDLEESVTEYKRYIDRIKKIASRLHDAECIVSDAQDLLNNFVNDLEE